MPSDTAPLVKSMREACVIAGRDPTELKFFPQMTPILGRTMEEAQAKWQAAKSMVDYKGGLAKLSTFMNLDFSKFPEDEPFDLETLKLGNAGVHTMIEAVQRYANQPMTPRLLGEIMAFCGFAAMPVGTPEMVADLMERWIVEADVDGFNLACKSGL